MLPKALLSGLLAVSIARALPAPELDEAHGELEVFKRDATPDARDLELAELHNVNMTEMYKHSQIKRDDGDHINIWVSRSFVEDGGEEEKHDHATKRQSQHVRLGHGADFESFASSDRCQEHTRDVKTNAGSPFKGGVDAMFKWADSNSGGFFIEEGGDWQPLVVAGSNSGANAVHRVQAVGSSRFNVGIKDVRNDADWTRNHAKLFDGRWRCSSTGRESCGPTGFIRSRYQVVHTGESA